MSDLLLGLLSSAGGGAVTGVIGTAVSSVFQLLNAKNEIKKQEINLAHEVKLQEMNLAINRDETERELVIAETAAAASQTEATYRHDISLNDDDVWGWVKSVRALTRPLLTYLLLGITFYITLQLLNDGELGERLGQTHTTDILNHVVSTIVYTTSGVLTWWFGGREARKRTGGR